ncbi:MAG: biopolymer transporter ExbD [Gemmataceae bacterium]|nr:biopolymer transporter ExbD [Gemmataceae bacterium]
MIELPQRSITRFFIPMIDVLLLLFCIYLVMPLATNEEGETEAERAAREKLVKRMETERAARGGKDAESVERLRAELEKLRKEKGEVLQQRLSVRVLEVDGKDGRLFYRDPAPVYFAGPEDARRLVTRDRESIGPARELFYLVLGPREKDSGYPTNEQWERYQGWFKGVALGFDTPGSGPGRKP